jgi:hypothetical protein
MVVGNRGRTGCFDRSAVARLMRQTTHCVFGVKLIVVAPHAMIGLRLIQVRERTGLLHICSEFGVKRNSDLPCIKIEH